MSATTGLDKAADDSHQFMVRLREIGTTFENLGIRIEGVMLQKIGPQLDHFQKWMDEHGEEIARRVGDIASAFVNAAAAMGPPLKWLADEFLELDKATDGWSTKLLLLVGIFKVLGGFQIIGGIWKMVAALRAMGAPQRRHRRLALRRVPAGCSAGCCRSRHGSLVALGCYCTATT